MSCGMLKNALLTMGWLPGSLGPMVPVLALDGIAGSNFQARKARAPIRPSFKTLWLVCLNRPSNSAALRGVVKVLTQVKVMRSRYAAKITMPISRFRLKIVLQAPPAN